MVVVLLLLLLLLLMRILQQSSPKRVPLLSVGLDSLVVVVHCCVVGRQEVIQAAQLLHTLLLVFIRLKLSKLDSFEIVCQEAARRPCTN